MEVWVGQSGFFTPQPGEPFFFAAFGGQVFFFFVTECREVSISISIFMYFLQSS